MFEGAGETDTVHKSEGQKQVTLQQTTTAHVLIWHVGSDDNCYATAYNSQPSSDPSVCMCVWLRAYVCVFEKEREE